MSLLKMTGAAIALFLPVIAWSQQSAEQPPADVLELREAELEERAAELDAREEELAAREAALEPVAEPAVEEEPSPWSGEIALGYLASSGNTDTSSLATRAKLAYTRNAWENWVEGKAFGSSDDNGTTAESYEVIGRSLYNWNEKNYSYGQIEWKKNRFSAYEEQWFETVGYGRRVLTGDVLKLNLEAGIGLSQQDKVVLIDPDGPVDGPTEIDTERNTVYTAGGEFIWQITEFAKFEQFATANIGPDNTFWETISRIKVDIVNSLALSVGYTIQGNTDVEGDTERTDKYTAVTLDYSF